MLMTFTDAILKHKVVANKLARILILFMVQNVKAIFTIPKEIRDRVNSRIDDLKTGEISPVRGNYVFFLFVNINRIIVRIKINCISSYHKMKIKNSKSKYEKGGIENSKNNYF